MDNNHPACWTESIVTVVAAILEEIATHNATGEGERMERELVVKGLYRVLAREIQAAETELFFYVEEKLPRNAGHYPIPNAKSRKMEAEVKAANAMATNALGHAWYRFAV
jgi:hypothetical protein